MVNPDNLFCLPVLLFIKDKSVQSQWIATYWTAVTNSDSFLIIAEEDFCKEKKELINDKSSNSGPSLKKVNEGPPWVKHLQHRQKGENNLWDHKLDVMTSAPSRIAGHLH